MIVDYLSDTHFDTYFHAFSNLIGYGLGGFSFATLQDD